MSALNVRRIGLGAAAALASASLLAACSSSSSSGSSNSSSGTQPPGGGTGVAQNNAASVSATSLKTRSTSIGSVLVDSAGLTVYELVGDSAAKPTCTGGCLAMWPAVKANGKQVVVNGHPAFTYVDDMAPGQTNGQNLTDRWGRWLALDGSGNPITGSGTAGSPAPQSSSASKKAPGVGGPAF